MSLKVIELNDSAVRVSDAQGLLVSSPGFALVGDKGIQLGEVAERQMRLQPTSSYNRFWHQLSMEPLPHSPGHVRHFADLAYAHLMHIADQAKIDGEVILAVPGNFTNQQLAILLGLTRQCPFQPIGVVDSALAGSVALAQAEALIYADIQLHQVLLTRFTLQNNVLQRSSVIQVPGVGSQNFMDLLMQLVTGLFVQQCRFNPQHNAESEQQLYNKLPAWLQQSNDGASSLVMEIKSGATVYQAKLPGESLVRKLEDYYRKISQQIAVLAGTDNCQVLIAQGLAQYPGLIANLKSHADVQTVSSQQLSNSCIELRSHIASAEKAFHFVTGLPVTVSSTARKTNSRVSDTASRHENSTPQDPTHLLFDASAFPVDNLEIISSNSHNGSKVLSGKLALGIADMPDYLGQLERKGEQVFVVCGEAGALLNDAKVAGKHRLFAGDRIAFGGKSLSLIKVHDGQT